MQRERTSRRAERVRTVLARRQPDLSLILSNIHDPHNVSAVYRSCDAFGVAKVHLYYTDTAFPVLGRKSSASARKWVVTERHSDAGRMAATLRKEGVQLLATGFSETAKPLTQLDFTRPTAVMLGNEHDGVGPELKALADQEVYIPMMGMVQSLNVSVAAAIILYEAWRQRTAAGMYDNPRFDNATLEQLAEQWMGM